MKRQDRHGPSRRELLAGGAALLVGGPAWSAMALPTLDARGPAALTARLADIRSLREIKRLQHSWGHLADAGEWHEMAALFTPDGVWSDNNRQVAGRAAIEALLVETMGGGVATPQPKRLNLRLFLSPVITLAADGRSATGRWHEVAMTGEAGVRADWAGGIHVIDYALTADGWRIARMQIHPQFAGSYADGFRSVPTFQPVPYHYTPDQAGTPVPLAREAAAPMPAARIGQGADQLLAASAAQNLVAAFGYYLDRKLYDDVLDLFAADAACDVAGVGSFEGKAGIRRMLGRFGAPGLAEGELNDRLQLMPVVTVSADAREAQVRTYVLGMTGHHHGATFWTATIHHFVARRGSDGIWRLIRLDATPRMRAAYEAGWADPLPAALAQVAGSEPDKPSLLPAGDYPNAVAPTPGFAPVLAPEPTGVAPRDAATRLSRALAFDAVENICCAYGYYLDEFRWDETADLFSTDGWKELSYVGTYIGRERIRGSMFNRYGHGARAGLNMPIHQKTQPYVTVSPDGKRAFVRLRLWQFNAAPNAPGLWLTGIYENQAMVENGVWKIHGMDLDYAWLADTKSGWAGVVAAGAERFAPKPEIVARFPPDAPLRGVTFAPYPKVVVSGFHFANPVSGRRPELLLGWSDGRRATAQE